MSAAAAAATDGELRAEWRSLISLIALGLTIWRGWRNPECRGSWESRSPAAQVLRKAAAMAMARNKLCSQLKIISRTLAKDKSEKRWKDTLSQIFGYRKLYYSYTIKITGIN